MNIPLIRVLPERVSEGQIIRIAIDISSALAVYADHGIVHGDVSPWNIFWSDDGTCKLAPPAISIKETDRIGALHFAAPEIYRGHASCSSDVYSLGLVLYWMLNERRAPFCPLPPALPSPSEVNNAMIRRFAGKPLPPPEHGNDKLKQIILKACAFEISARYREARELRTELRRISLA